jgi:hypothetical protein
VARSVAEIAALAVLGCGGGSSSPPPPATSIAPAAAPIVDAWATALGGRDKVDRVLGRYRIVLDYRHKRVWLDPLVSAGSD